MDHEEEVRRLREQTTALQWALSGTLSSCHAIGQQADVDDELLARIQSLQKAVQNLGTSSHYDLAERDESQSSR